MIQLQSIEQLQRAIENARAADLFVQPTTFFRQYRVTNRANGNTYVVNFYVRDGKRFGGCTCKAGQLNKACKHLAAAAGLHLCRAAEARAAQTSH